MTTDSTAAAETARGGLLERHTIGPVPAAERNGTGWGLFGIWLGVSMLPLTVVTGALATAVFGLSFWWAVTAVLVGNVFGGIFMGLHASQGPELGVPQMLQARGQFGARGAAFVVVVALVMFMGFFVSNVVVGAQAIHQVVPSISVNTGIWLAVAISLVISAVGLRLIKILVSFWAVVIGILGAASFVWIIADGIPSGALSAGSFTSAGFFSMVAVGAVWQIAFAPYVSDFSRYMPSKTGVRGAFWGTYGGSVLSGSLMMTLGALVGALSAEADAMSGLDGLLGGFGPTVLFCFALASASTNAGNIYCAMLNALTLIETFVRGWLPGVRGRLIATLALHVLGLGMSILGQGSFLTNFTNFITLLLYVLIPWSAINLVDYFLVKHGDYDVDSFFAADGGIYGLWNTTALAVYAVGIVVQIPFAVTPSFSGPFAEDLGGVDVAWCAGLLVSGVLYYVLARRTVVSSPAPTLTEELVNR
ncbi:cytosine permease [Rhodococcus opacus]|uniref:purine-cytosine permease family protein n=1 Tax=Rhodococcus opacus TaxID=37919 RepID=UPI001FF2E69A|nr:cytosine permease [Rhodococcus opacus]UOT02453.1 cytosine permease [Rhodococcus opacus]